MKWWHRWHTSSLLLRAPLKLVCFAAIVLLTLFPRPTLLVTLIERVQRMDTLIDPTHPRLAELESRVRAALPAGATARDALRPVEATVYQSVPYKHDWETRGVMEHLATTAEIFEMGSDDCDGRAVIAASLLRRMGYEARLATDLLHMWVETPEGETMSPTSTVKVLVSTSQGTRVDVTPALLKTWARGWSYGVATFPLQREIIIMLALFLVTLHPWSSGWRRFASLLLLWIGLDLVRDQGELAAMNGNGAWLVALGFAVFFAGWVTLAIRTRRNPVPVATP
ncbi:MAG: hypothetical protein ACKVS9_06810 [Phycisphaerae bacterium]